VLAFHHHGLREHVTRVDKIVAAELGEQWLDAPRPVLPFVPSRVLPRNCIMQDRVRVGADGAAEHYQKPRITTDASDGGEESPNAGVPFCDRTVGLTDVHELGRAAAIADTATPLGDGTHDDDVRAGLFAVDLESAYRFLPMQEADLWTQVLLWDVGGEPGFIVDRRLCFGGAYAVNRFQRVSMLYVAAAQAKVAQFDLEQPPPPIVRAWSARRALLQRRGQLPAGNEQLHPRYSKPYLDDATGTALCDEVRVPTALSHIALPLTSAEPGGSVASHSSRLAVHCRLFIAVAQELGFAVQPTKVQLGDPVVALGFAVGVRSARIRCPGPKCDGMVAQLRELAADAAATPPAAIECAPVGKLTGRLLNISQTAPELTPLLHIGYALSSPTLGARPGGRRLRHVSLSAGSRRHREWVALIDAALEVLSRNEGVPLSAASSFPATDQAGTLTITTDASGDDGFGGWATSPDAPQTMFILSAEWPADVGEALRCGKAPIAERGTRASLSMPAAETFAARAVAAAVSARLSVAAVVAVVDCQPAVSVLSGTRSPNAQMRVVGSAGAGVPPLVLGVHVVRELNLDADRLSHPRLADGVADDARSAGWRVVQLQSADVPSDCWRTLRQAMHVGCDAGVPVD
jgi:hypothetical protein